MRRIRELLRLKYEGGLSYRDISASTMSTGSISDYLRRVSESGLTWDSGDTLTVYDRETGEATAVELYVAVLGASQQLHIRGGVADAAARGTG